MKTLENLAIRQTTSEDLEKLSQMYPSIYSDTDEAWSEKASFELLHFYFSLPTFLGLTAIYENEVVGAFFAYIKPWWDGNHLGEGELFIEPSHQRMGIGSMLYLEMMKLADKKGCVQQDLLTYIGKPADNWYKRIGFKETGQTHLTGNIKEVMEKLES